MSVKMESLSVAEEDRLASFSIRPDPARKGYYTGSPKIEHLSEVFKMGINFNAPYMPGYTSFNGYLAYGFLLKGVQIFTQISHRAVVGSPTYITPHVQDKETCNIAYLGTLSGKHSAVEANGGQYTVHPSLGDCLVAPMDSTRLLAGRFITFDSLDLLDNTDGIVFPYFDLMVNPDKTTAIDTFLDLYLDGLSSNPLITPGLVMRIKSGARDLSITSAGRIISHLYKGIQTARRAEAAMTVLVHANVYRGFILQGSFSSMSLFGEKVEAVGKDLLIQEIRKLRGHEVKLEQIAIYLRKPTTVNEDGNLVPRYSYTADDLNTSRKLVTILHTVDTGLFERSFWDDIEAYTRELKFQEKFAQPTTANLRTAIRFIKTRDFNLLQPFPSYIGNKWVKEGDSYSLALAIFGPMPPSINYGKGSSVQSFFFATGEAPETNLIDDNDGNRPLRFIPLKNIPIKAAVDDWKSLVNNGRFMIPHPRKNQREFTNVKLVDSKITGAEMIVVYNELKELVEIARVSRPEKRRRDAEEGSKKRARKGAGMGADAMDFV
jgi:hypothetical protein